MIIYFIASAVAGVIIGYHWHPRQDKTRETHRLLHSLIYKLQTMANELDDLAAAVAKDIEVDESAITLLNGIKAKLDAAIASNNPAKLKELSASIGASTQKLADAVVANTPAEEPPAEPPVEG